MKHIVIIALSLLAVLITSCSKDDPVLKGEFEFIMDYNTTITVGGVVGLIDLTFEAGEVYEGTDDGSDQITIRIAEHTELNKDCPNNCCYQEFLEVPHEYLKFID